MNGKSDLFLARRTVCGKGIGHHFQAALYKQILDNCNFCLVKRCSIQIFKDTARSVSESSTCKGSIRRNQRERGP